MKQNIKGILSYDGTQYFGWQKTKMGPSIEEILQNVLERILQHPIKIQAASRTDRGVHAIGQVINFFTNKSFVDLPKLLKGIRGLLPKDISMHTLEFVGENFHPTIDNTGKEYHYFICNTDVQIPFYQKFSWHVPSPLHIGAMRKGAKMLIGTHDFSTFSNMRTKNPIRTVENILIEELTENRILISIKGKSFLYKMVRNIVGTLIYISCGKIPLDQLQEIFMSKKRELAGVTAPAHALYLKEVFY